MSLLIYVNGGVMSQSVEPVLLRSQIFLFHSFFFFCFVLVPVRLVSFVLLPLTSFGPLVPNEYCLNDTVYLHIVADPSYNISLERSKSSQTGLLNMTVSSLNSNGALLEWVREICIMDVQSTNLQLQWCFHVNTDLNSWGMFPAPCWIYVMKKRVLARCT